MTAAAVLLVMTACSSQKKLARLQEEKVEIQLPREADYLPDNVSGEVFRPADTLYVKGEDGRNTLCPCDLRGL